MSTKCADCGQTVTFGEWPYCPHGFPLGSRRDRHQQKTVYYRDAEGKVCIPPDPNMIPAGYTAIKIESVREAEALQREVGEDYRQRWSDHGEFTQMMEQSLDNPRRQLIDRMQVTKSNLERDTIRELVKDMDNTQSQRENVRSEARFEWLGR